MINNKNVHPSLILRIILLLIFLVFIYITIFTIKNESYMLLLLYIPLDILFLSGILLFNVKYNILNNVIIIQYPFFKPHKYKIDEIIGYIILENSICFYTENGKFEITTLGKNVKNFINEILNNYNGLIIDNGEKYFEKNGSITGGLIKKIIITPSGITTKGKIYKWNELQLEKKLFGNGRLDFEFKTNTKESFSIHTGMYRGIIGIFSYIEKQIEKSN